MLREDMEVLPQALILVRSRCREDCVCDDLSTVRRDPRGVGAKDDRERIFGNTHPTQRPDIMVIQGRGPNLDHFPSVGRSRLGDLADIEPRKGIVG